MEFHANIGNPFSTQIKQNEKIIFFKKTLMEKKWKLWRRCAGQENKLTTENLDENLGDCEIRIVRETEQEIIKIM